MLGVGQQSKLTLQRPKIFLTWGGIPKQNTLSHSGTLCHVASLWLTCTYKYHAQHVTLYQCQFLAYVISTWFRFSLVYRQNCHEQVHCQSPGVFQRLLEGLRRNTWALKKYASYSLEHSQMCWMYGILTLPYIHRIWDWSISSTNSNIIPSNPVRQSCHKDILPRILKMLL